MSELYILVNSLCKLNVLLIICQKWKYVYWWYHVSPRQPKPNWKSREQFLKLIQTETEY